MTMQPRLKQVAQDGAPVSDGLRWDGSEWAPDPLLLGDDAWFGDGSDGSVTISANTTLTRDMLYDDLTIDPGFTLFPDGFRIFVKGTLTNNGTIARNGNGGLTG